MKKTAFITGATAGIGQATAYSLAKNGWNLILSGRRTERLNQLKEKLTILELLKRSKLIKKIIIFLRWNNSN